MPDNTQLDLSADQHRFVFKALKLENQALAKAGEFVVDLESGIIYVMGTDGELHSKAAEIAARLDELEQAGLIDSALAFENNAKIYTLYVTGNHCRIDTGLKLNKTIRYYAIRGVTADGQMQYMTGQLNNGNIENALVDVLPFTSDPAVAYPGEAQQGTLHTPSLVMDGHPYYIDFFDVNRVIVSTVPCQVVHVSSLDFALSPDKNIVALEISTSQDMVDDGADISFIYQGQSLKTLNVYVHALYSNGDRRYINHELSTSRLVLNIPEDDDVDRNTIGNTFNITARYYTEELNSGEDGAYNDQNYASIDGSRTVKVIEDVFVGVDYLFPVPVVRTQDGGVKVIKLHTFAKYANNQFVDVTSNARLSTSTFNEESFGIIQTFNMALGVGHAGQIFEETGLRLQMDAVNYGRWTLLDVPNSPNGQYGVPIARFDPISNPGQIRMRLQPSEAQLYANSAAFAQTGKVGDVIPTHFRVRSVIESGFVHTIVPVSISEFNEFNIIDTNTVQNKLAGYAANNDGVTYPVLVDFYTYDATSQQYTWVSAVPYITQQYVFDQVSP
jgi:hypothetical protein